MGLNFQRLRGSESRFSKRRSCSSSLTDSQYFTRISPSFFSDCSNEWAEAQELFVLVLGAEAHDVLDPGAVVPAAVEQHDLPGGRQVGGVALEVPLRALALAGGGKRRDAAGAWIQEGDDAFDHPVLARRVAALEQHHQPLLGGDHPLLHVDELGLQAQQLLLVLLVAELAWCAHASMISSAGVVRLARARLPGPGCPGPAARGGSPSGNRVAALGLAP